MPSRLDRYALALVDDIGDTGALLRAIPNDDPFSLPRLLIERVKTGEYRAAWITEAGEKVGLTVWDVDDTGGHRELVSVATVMQRGHPTARFEIQNRLEELAKEAGCQSIRMSTVRPGLLRESFKLGYHVAEVVLRKRL